MLWRALINHQAIVLAWQRVQWDSSNVQIHNSCSICPDVVSDTRAVRLDMGHQEGGKPVALFMGSKLRGLLLSVRTWFILLQIVEPFARLRTLRASSCSNYYDSIQPGVVEACYGASLQTKSPELDRARFVPIRISDCNGSPYRSQSRLDIRQVCIME